MRNTSRIRTTPPLHVIEAHEHLDEYYTGRRSSSGVDRVLRRCRPERAAGSARAFVAAAHVPPLIRSSSPGVRKRWACPRTAPSSTRTAPPVEALPLNMSKPVAKALAVVGRGSATRRGAGAGDSSTGVAMAMSPCAVSGLLVLVPLGHGPALLLARDPLDNDTSLASTQRIEVASKARSAIAPLLGPGPAATVGAAEYAQNR